jgi:hypothetical protein
VNPEYRLRFELEVDLNRLVQLLAQLAFDDGGEDFDKGFVDHAGKVGGFAHDLDAGGVAHPVMHLQGMVVVDGPGLGIPQQVDMHCRIVRMLAQFGQVQVGPEKSDGQILADDDHDADQQGGAPDSGTGLQTVEQLVETDHIRTRASRYYAAPSGTNT